MFVEVVFFSAKRKYLPTDGYRQDAIFNKSQDYWGITFIRLPIEQFDVPTEAFLKFSFQDCHYQEVVSGQSFRIMEGFCQVGEEKVDYKSSYCFTAYVEWFYNGKSEEERIHILIDLAEDFFRENLEWYL